MTALCSRVDCSEPATAVFGFDAVAALVWLDPFDGHAKGAGMLCAAHADALTPLWGWTLQDRRMPAPRLWAERPRVPAQARATNRRSRRPSVQARSRPHHQQPEPTDPLPFDGRSEPAFRSGTEPAFRSEAEPVDVPTEFDRLLDARTPLLTRAFQAARGRAQ